MTEPIGRQGVLTDAAARGLSVDIVVRRKSPLPATHLFTLVAGDRQISWPKLRALVGANTLAMPDESLTIKATGYGRGTITPLGSTTAWPVYADASIVDRRIVDRRSATGAGEHGFSAFVDADARRRHCLRHHGATDATLVPEEKARRVTRYTGIGRRGRPLARVVDAHRGVR